MSKKVIGVCNYCGKETALCKAHIIPKWAYKKNDIYKLIPVDTKENIKRSPMGAYDNSILCKDCDNNFIGKNYDNPAFDIFNKIDLSYKKPQYIWNDRDKRFEKYFDSKLTSLEKKVFSKFLLSILWRASISSKTLGKTINLNKYQDIIFNIISDKDKPIGDNIEISFYKVSFSSVTVNLNNMTTIYSKSDKGFNHTYFIMFKGYMFVIAVGNRIINPLDKRFILNSDDYHGLCFIEMNVLGIQNLFDLISKGQEKIKLSYKK